MDLESALIEIAALKSEREADKHRIRELEEWQTKALDYLPKPLRIDAEFVDRVGERMGVSHGAWDTVDPVVLCKAVLLESGR